MAPRSRVYGLDRLITLGEVAGRMDRSAQQDIRKAVRKSLDPVVPDAQARFAALPGPGHKAARTVRISSSGNKVTLSVGSSSVPTALPSEFGARYRGTRPVTWTNQWGRADGRWYGVKNIDYSKSFGRYTGTRGKAFLPAVRKGLRQANKEADQLAREWVEKLARA